MDKVLSAMLDPMLQVCVLGSATLDNIESATYMLNCLCAINVNLVSNFNSSNIFLDSATNSLSTLTLSGAERESGSNFSSGYICSKYK